MMRGCDVLSFSSCPVLCITYLSMSLAAPRCPESTDERAIIFVKC